MRLRGARISLLLSVSGLVVELWGEVAVLLLEESDSVGQGVSKEGC